MSRLPVTNDGYSVTHQECLPLPDSSPGYCFPNKFFPLHTEEFDSFIKSQLASPNYFPGPMMQIQSRIPKTMGDRKWPASKIWNLVLGEVEG